MGDAGETRYQDENPEVAEGDTVWITPDESVDGEQFVEMLDKAAEARGSLEALRDTLDDMETGLDREDTIRLIKGHNGNVALDDIEAVFSVLDDIVEADMGEMAPRLISSKAGNMKIEEVAEIWGEIERLAEKYGTPAEETEDQE